MARRVFIYNGMEGLPKIAKMNGLKFSQLHYYINKRDLTVAQAVEELKRQEELANTVTYQGIIGIESIALITGITPDRLKRRFLVDKMLIEDAVALGNYRKPNTKNCEKIPLKAQVGDKPRPMFGLLEKLVLGLITRKEFDSATKAKQEKGKCNTDGVFSSDNGGVVI